MLKKIISIIVLVIFLVGCNETYREEQNLSKQDFYQDKEKIENGIKTFALNVGQVNIYSFVMQEDGFVNIGTHGSYCKLNLIDNRGKVIDKISIYKPEINPQINKGKYYIEIQAKDDRCDNFSLFSPKILDKYTDGSQDDITNGEQDLN